MSNEAVFKAGNAAYRYLSVLPRGTRMTVHTNESASARTNILAVLEKENDWNDWRVVSRPATADAIQLRETWPADQAISTTDLASAFEDNDALWAIVEE